jgi:hypothetical protein
MFVHGGGVRMLLCYKHVLPFCGMLQTLYTHNMHQV